MNTSSRFVVALHVLTIMVLSRLRGVEVLTSENLAEGVNTNAVVVRRILGRLRAAGLVVSVPGPTGGSRLARAPDKVTLQNVYEALDEGELFHMHYSEPNQACPIGCNIQGVLAGPLDAAAQAMKESLASKTLADIAGQMQKTCEQNEQTIESAV
ncbi:MAG: Rrf2 family protein [Planctomycetota bacterium]|jgi:Rrf2 family protein